MLSATLSSSSRVSLELKFRTGFLIGLSISILFDREDCSEKRAEERASTGSKQILVGENWAVMLISAFKSRKSISGPMSHYWLGKF